jgi:hypothetical protein
MTKSAADFSRFRDSLLLTLLKKYGGRTLTRFRPRVFVLACGVPASGKLGFPQGLSISRTVRDAEGVVPGATVTLLSFAKYSDRTAPSGRGSAGGERTASSGRGSAAAFHRLKPVPPSCPPCLQKTPHVNDGLGVAGGAHAPVFISLTQFKRQVNK